MSKEIDEKIEEVIERKVEEKLEKQTRDEIEDSVIDKKIEEKIAEKVANRDKREKQNFVEKTQEGISRRKFLKMLGVGAGGLALSSSVAGLTWSKITPSSQGTSDIKSSTVEDGAITSAKLSSSSVTKNKLGFNFDESAQDAVGSALTGDFSYDDANNQIGLAFDPSTHATSTELNNHANDANAHHSRPAGTQTSGVIGSAASSDGSQTEYIFSWVSSASFSNDDSGSRDVTLYTSNGTQTATISAGATSETVNVDAFVSQISYGSYTGLEAVTPMIPSLTRHMSHGHSPDVERRGRLDATRHRVRRGRTGGQALGLARRPRRREERPMKATLDFNLEPAENSDDEQQTGRIKVSVADVETNKVLSGGASVDVNARESDSRTRRRRGWWGSLRSTTCRSWN